MIQLSVHKTSGPGNYDEAHAAGASCSGPMTGFNELAQ